MTADPRIISFLDFHARTTDEDMPAAIAHAIEEDGGTVQDPTAGWPGSHMYEFSLYGITGFGASMPEAAMDWFRAARRQARDA